jgi:phosphoribosyl 1,2-cyclic phosphodiesterase
MTARVTFWGVRGSIPCPEPDFMDYGGHTSCVSVELGEDLLILDAGSGLQKLGRSDLVKRYRTIHILLSHAHLDHIMGLPFFAPLYDPAYTVHFYARPATGETVDGLLKKMLTPPFSPVTTETFRATLHFHAFGEGESVRVRNHTIATHPLNHPGGSTGYRIPTETGSLCYITDTEHTVGETDEHLVGFIKNSDCLIYDSMFCDTQFTPYIGWGHSTWQEGVRLQEKAGVKTFFLFHYSPDAIDDHLKTLEATLEKTWGHHVRLAKEGACLYV